MEELALLWSQAFPSRNALERTRELCEGMTYGSLADCWIARAGGMAVGALRTYRLTLHARGRCWPTLGLAAVAVAPDYRRRGLARRMCVQALRIGRERGCVLGALFPFRTSFYADLGFSLIGTLLRHRFGPDELRALYPAVARGSTELIERPELAGAFSPIHAPPRTCTAMRRGAPPATRSRASCARVTGCACWS